MPELGDVGVKTSLRKETPPCSNQSISTNLVLLYKFEKNYCNMASAEKWSCDISNHNFALQELNFALGFEKSCLLSTTQGSNFTL